jgi:glycogen operon protein
MTPIEIWPGQRHPLGAHYDGSGTNFALFSSVAERVELCLFDDHGGERRVALPEVTAECWHGYVPDVSPGQRFGFRVHGPWAPEHGHRCNPNKLLLDPYAKAIDGAVQWGQPVFPYPLGEPDGAPDASDSAASMPKAVVVNPFFDWRDDRFPRTPSHRTVIYEAHVRGLTARHPGVPEALRGRYAGIAHPVVIEHLTRLGVTALELMPVHQFVHDASLLERGLRNYWGYNTIGFFAPHDEYAAGEAGEQVTEFKTMVRALHAAGIEVILDVVYNHTAEGNHLGPMLAFKGIDNAAYYRTVADDPRHYVDYTGCGNSLNMRHPHVLQLIMDSLRYWIEEMHVDGFRFDLAAALARELHDVDRLSAFFDLIQQDPVVSQAKLIAEPWDLGEGGYQVGNFPPVWSEWNGRYRDDVRDFWRGADSSVDSLAQRLTGSSDLYGGSRRRPWASVNFVTAHDGFTLRDLVSYDHKHNQANGEDDRDGESHNRSWNCGVEGPTDDPDVLALRARQQRNFLATLFLSQGIPMLLAGDEIGRSQGGNNNAYCQDNEISWLDWEHADEELLAFTARVIGLRDAEPVFRRRGWFQGRPIRGGEPTDVAWLRADGVPMRDEDWQTGFVKSLGMFLNGEAIPTPGPRGERIVGASFLALFNAHHEALSFRLPGEAFGAGWQLAIDTAARDGGVAGGDVLPAGGERKVEARSLVVLRRIE